MTDLISPPAALWLLLTTFVLVGGGLVYYALRTKGDVFAKLTHGPTTFELQAKERQKIKKLE